MKKFIFIFLSFFLSLIFIYLFLFIYYYLTYENKFKYNFQSLQNLNFYKKYSKKVNHLRYEVATLQPDLDPLDQTTKRNILYYGEDLLFNVLNDSSSNKLTLLQGDSWFQQINEFDDVKNYIDDSQKNVKFVNGGIASFSPSLMNIQFNILENDFNIKPEIVIAYIDQTDIGDEFCRYKNLRTFDKQGVLISVPYEKFPTYKGAFNLHELIIFSEIDLKYKSKFIKTQKFINYRFIKSLEKIKKQYQKKIIKNNYFEKCGGRKLDNYLRSANQEAIEHFELILNEYLNMLSKKKYLKKIFIVTHPHKLQITTSDYKLDVSDLVSKAIQAYPKVEHINFSKIINENLNFYSQDPWLNDLIHLNQKGFFLFFKKILQTVNK